MRLLFVLFNSLLIISCTQGRLEYVTKAGELKVACATEYTWQPSVDRYAVEYTLSYCAKRAVEQGHTVVDSSLLTLDTSIPLPPNGKSWNFEYAKSLHQDKKSRISSSVISLHT